MLVFKSKSKMVTLDQKFKHGDICFVDKVKGICNLNLDAVCAQIGIAWDVEAYNEACYFYIM